VVEAVVELEMPEVELEVTERPVMALLRYKDVLYL
jgi:hypothetical protein